MLGYRILMYDGERFVLVASREEGSALKSVVLSGMASSAARCPPEAWLGDMAKKQTFSATV